VREVCRKIGLPPDPTWLPPAWGGKAVTADALPTETAECAPAGGWPRPMDDTGAGLPLPKPSTPDSS
jgi:hypothetical protein